MKDSAQQARRLNEALDQLIVERVQADDDDLHVTVDGEWLRDLFRQERQRYAALLAALDALVAEMKDFGDDHVTFYAGQLAAELAKHRRGRDG